MNKIDLGTFFSWRPINIISNLKMIVKSIKTFYIRGRCGVAPMDAWNLDIYMIQVLNNGLIELRDSTIAYPSFITEDEWKNVLSHMIFLTEIILKEDSDESEELFEKYLEIGKRDDDLRDAWFKKVKEWHEYRQDCLFELCDYLKEWGPHLWW